MQKYINQLLSDLENVIKNPPSAPYIEVPPHMADVPDLAEIALSPPTTLVELTGIPFVAFPNILDLKKKQWEVLAVALKRLLEALNMQITDLPDGYPDDALYDVIVNHWEEPLQYLPLAGYDLEFCSGNQDTCPYGEDCNFCFGDFDDSEPTEGIDSFVGVFFNDDGTRIDPMKVHVPELCLGCMRYLSEDWEDNVLCTLTRSDNNGDRPFECHAFRG